MWNSWFFLLHDIHSCCCFRRAHVHWPKKENCDMKDDNHEFFFLLIFTFALVFAMLMCTGPVNEALSRSRSDLAEPLVNFLFFVLFSLLFTFCSDPAEYSVNFLFWFFYCYSMFFLWSRVHCTLSHSSVNFCFWFFIITYIFLWSLFYIKTSEICSRKPSLLIIFIIIYMWESH